MYNRDSFFSKKLTFLYAILTFLIVLLHSVPLGRYGMNVSIEHPFIYCTAIFCNIGVPLFFFISSLLFYRSCEYVDIKRKLKTRVYSLLLPYLLWNTIFVLIYFSITRIPIIVEYMNMGKVLDTPYSFVVAIIDSRFTPLWFVKDLMIFCVMSPLILFIIKRLWLAFVILILSILSNLYWKFGYQDVLTWMPVYLTGALFGRYLTYEETENGGSTIRKVVKSKYARNVVSIILVFCFIALYVITIKNESYVYVFGMVSPLILWILVDIVLFEYIKSRFKIKQWMGYAFFIYCTHFFVLNVLQKLVVMLIAPTSLMLNIIFVLSPIITIVILTYVAKLLSKYSFYKYMSGGR